MVSLPPEDPGSRRVPCRRLGEPHPAGAAHDSDLVAEEEPLELRVADVAIATLLRTPGSDRHLALGFFLTEGWISGVGDVGALAMCGRGASSETEDLGAEDNVVNLVAASGVLLRPPADRPRLLPATSSCGVCGKRTIEEVLSLTPLGADGCIAPVANLGFQIGRGTLTSLPERLRGGQRLFRSTGAIHAAGLFDLTGNRLWIEEDVGRHNAVDKVIGWALLEMRLPLERAILQVSGRVSFEIVQKAFRAGIPVVSAVSGVTSLAIELASKAGVSLVGFVRGGGAVVYTHEERIGP